MLLITLRILSHKDLVCQLLSVREIRAQHPVQVQDVQNKRLQSRTSLHELHCRGCSTRVLMQNRVRLLKYQQLIVQIKLNQCLRFHRRKEMIDLNTNTTTNGDGNRKRN